MTGQPKPEENMQTVTPTGKPVQWRIATPAAAYQVYSDLKTGEDAEAMRRAILRGMIDGNPPYDDTELQEAGLGFMVNVNFMTMRANLDARAAAAHELFMEVPVLVELKALSAKKGEDAVKLQGDLQIIAEEFTVLLEDWPEFLSTMDLVVRESDAYGIGFGLWPDEWDWRLQAFERANLLIDARARIDINRNDVYGIRGELDVAQLIQVTENEERSRDEGWNVGAVKDLLVQVFVHEGEHEGDERHQMSSWESLQARIRNNDITYQTKQFAKVRVVHLLSREVSGGKKISHLIIPESDLKGSKVFLYEGRSRFDRMDQVIWWLPYNYGNGWARSVRGVASLMASHEDLSNRFLCRVFDAGYMSASLLLQPSGPTDMTRLALIRHGPYTVLPPELKAVQATFQPQIEPLVRLRDVSESVMRNNTGTYRPHAETIDQLAAPKTARQVVEETSKELRYEKAAIAHRYVHLERFYREVMRRVLRAAFEAPPGVEVPGQEQAKAFVQRCVDRGVKKEVLRNWQKRFRLYAMRAVGLGSLSFRYDITNQVLQARPLFDEIGQVNATRDWLAARVGFRNVDRYRMQVNRDLVPSEEHSHAALENNDLKEGSPVVVGTDQLHAIHIASHVQGVISPIVQAVEQDQIGDPQRMLGILQVAIPHVQEHAQPLAQDPERKDFLKQLEQVLRAAGKAVAVLSQLVDQIQKAQEQQAQEQEERLQQAEDVLRDRELEAKVLEIQSKYQIAAMDQQNQGQVRMAKAREQGAMQRQRVADEMRLKAERQAVDLELARRRAEMEEEIARMKAQQGGGEAGGE